MTQQRGNLAGIGLVTIRTGLGFVEDAGDMRYCRFGYRKDALQRLDLIACHTAVGLGKFGNQGDHGNGEGELEIGRMIDDLGGMLVGAGRPTGLHRLVDKVSGRNAHQRPERPSEREEADRTADDLAPDAHALISIAGNRS